MDELSGREPGQCRLLEGPVAIIAQLALCAFVLASLFLKRALESPRRTIKVWAMDVSKQGFSALAAHLCNMITAILAAGLVHSSRASECSWYFVVYSIDTSIGVTLTILLHNLVISTARQLQRNSYSRLEATTNPVASWGTVVNQRWFDYLARCGYYGDPPALKPWLWQIGEWTLVTVLARAFCASLVILLGRYGLVDAANFIDRLFAGHPKLLLLFVMVMCPVFMNIVQAFIQDAVLRWRRRAKNGKVSRYVDSEQEVVEIVNDGWSDDEDI